VETLPEYLLGMSLSSRSQIRASIWGFRLGLLIMIVLFSSLNAHSTLVDLVCGFGFVLMFLTAEHVLMRDIKSATPIKIYQNGVLLPMVHYDWLRGLRGFVPFEQIDHVEVKRREIYQMMMFRNAWGIKWLDAPIIMVFHLKDGKRYSSNTKVPGQVLAMTDLLNSRFGIRVEDRGSGHGGMVQYQNGKPID
jgi:hypothetical protein